MEEISAEPEPTVAKDEGPSEGAKKSEETELYSKLESPTEDLYAEAQFPLSKRKAGGALGLQDVRLWRGVSAGLGLICLILIFIVVLLVIRLQDRTPAATCPPPQATRSPLQRSTSFNKPCQVSQCAPGWLQHGESCFLLSELRNTWDEAKRNCSDMSADLAVIRTRSVQTFLTESDPPLKYWIGLRNDRSWTWVDGQSLSLKYWSDNSSRGNCALLKGGDPSDKSWYQSSCSLSTYFICQRRISTA